MDMSVLSMGGSAHCLRYVSAPHDRGQPLRSRMVDPSYIQSIIVAHILGFLCVLWNILSSFFAITLKTSVGLIGTLIILLAFKNQLDVPLGALILDAMDKAMTW